MYTNDKPEGKVDLRVRRTRKLLWEALLRLLESRTFDSLTVQEICDEAMVHRTTFYKHFEDKYHLISFGLGEIEDVFAGVSYTERLLHPMKLFEDFRQTRQFQALFKSVSENSILSNMMMKRGFEKTKQDLILAQNDGARFEGLPLDAVAAFYAGATTALCGWWMNSGMKASAEEVDGYLNRMINRNLFMPE